MTGKSLNSSAQDGTKTPCSARAARPCQKFEVIDTFDIRAPMAVAERLAELAHNRSYVEIGSRHGDIFECVAHHAARAAVVEADASYCAILRERMRYVPHASVRCPAMFPKDSGTLHADVYYTWIAPAVALNLLHELRGRVRHAATFVTIVFPLEATTLPPPTTLSICGRESIWGRSRRA